MNILRLAKSSLTNLTRYKLRTAFMMMGTLIGVATLTFVISAGTAASKKLLETAGQLFGSSSILVSAGGGFFMGGPRDAARLTLDDIQAVVDRVAGIDVWDPVQIAPDTPVRRGNRSTEVRLMGLSERSERVWNRGASSGSYFDVLDVARSARVAVIGATAATVLFSDEDPLGQEIMIGQAPFRILGVLERFGTDIHGMDRDNEIVIPVTTAMRRVMSVDSIAAAKLIVGEQSDVETISRQVVETLRERHGLTRGQPDDFTVITSVAVRQMVARIERVLFLYLPLVTAASLLAALAVAASLMLASVSERKQEIGLRRALGARPRDIGAEFLLETAATTLVGGIAGLLVSGLGILVAAQMLKLGATMTVGAAALGLLLSVVTGLVAGIAPARRAALLAPADALR